MEQWDIIGSGCDQPMDAHACFQEEYASLDGKWRHLALNGNEPAPQSWLEEDFDDRKWARALLPGNTEGAGLYRRSFILSRDQGSRRIIFRIAQAPEQLALWINGQLMGHVTGLVGDVEFDITKAVRTEKNRVCIRSSGPITGSLALYTQPNRCITDIQPRLQRTGQGDAALALHVKARSAEGFTARIALMEQDKVIRYSEATIEGGECVTLLDCAGICRWSPETPALYRVAVILWDGVAIHHTRELTIGIRETGMEDEVLIVNGQPERVHAVIYEPDPGADMEAELRLLRDHNFNGICLTRPASDALLGVCDRLGLYVLEQTGLSAGNPSLTERLHALHSCHPCLIGWDLEPVDGWINQIMLPAPLPLASEQLWEQSVSIIGAIRELSAEGQSVSRPFDENGPVRSALRAAKVLLSPIVCSFADSTLTVENRNRFLSTGAFDGQLVLTRDGEVALTRPIEMEIAPGCQGSMAVETRYDIYKPGRYHLAAEFRRKSDGVLVARDQWEVGNLKHIYDENPGGTIRDEAGRILLRAQDFSYAIDRATASPQQIVIDGLELLNTPLTSVFSGSFSGIRIPDEYERFTARWKKAKPAVLEVDQMTRTIMASFRLGSGLMQTYRLFTDGSLSLELRLRTGKSAPDRMGWQCTLNPDVTQCQWFGLGPDGAGYLPGRYYGIHTLEPDSAALRDQVYSLRLTDSSGRGIRIRSEEHFRFSLKQEAEGRVLTILMPEAIPFAPHTTYNFTLTICPVK